MPGSVTPVRWLSALVGVGAGLALLLHRVRPGWPFPVSGMLVGGTALAGCALAAAGGALRPPYLHAGALVVTGFALVAGLPGAHNATFPWIELGRSRLALWEDLALWGLLAALVALGSARSWVDRGVGMLGVAALGWTLFGPIKSGFQALEATTPEMTTVPVLAKGAPVQMRWTRSFTTGSMVGLFPAVLKDEWALMEIAGGVQQEAARAELDRGTVSPSRASLQHAVRFGLWRALEGVVPVALALRIFGFPAAILGLWIGVSRPNAPRLLRASRAVLLAAVLVVPVANLLSLVGVVLFALPDDRGLWLPALASTSAWLVVVRLCLLASQTEERA